MPSDCTCLTPFTRYLQLLHVWSLLLCTSTPFPTSQHTQTSHVATPRRWNEAHGIRLFRLSSCIFPWMTFYHMEDLPDWTDIQAVREHAGRCTKW
jgi:hypothetical protein